MEKNPLGTFRRSNDLYALVLDLFIFLDSIRIEGLHKAYNRFLKEKEEDEYEINKKELVKLDNLIDYLLFSHTIGFSAWKQSWLDFADNTPVALPVYCLCTLIKIDAIIRTIILEKDSYLIFEGPMCTDNTYFLYLKKSRNTFFSSVFQKEKIYPGRTTISFLNDSVNKYFNNFVVIKKSYLFDFIPQIYRYSGREINHKTIRVAVVPFLKTCWFRTHQFDDTKTFSISYSEYSMKITNNAYKDLIAQAEEESADIIIFPEMAMNSLTKDIVKEAMINAPKSFEHLKLCFFGSEWKNRSNISLLMSTSGTVLATQKKKVPYYLHIEDDVYYREDIRYDNNLTLIDIESFGRIAYCICADINAKEIQSLIELMEVDFVFVSSYTKSTETMVKAAEDKASLSAMSTVLCNARSAKDPQKPEKHSNGFCIVPKANNKKLSSKTVFYISDNADNQNQGIFCFDLHSESCK